jgi:hypothetical protein
MTRIQFDQWAKQYLEAFLEPLGTVQRNLEVPGEAKFVDVWFTPATSPAQPDCNLGLLTRIATTACLLEPFRNPPSRQEVRVCLLKLFWLQEDQRRKVEQTGRSQTEQALPRLWILAATMTKPVIAEFGGQPRDNWPLGVYFLPEALKSAIVVLDQLPQTEETLWLRILGRDQTQQQAIAELRMLSQSDPRRANVLQLLVNWRISLELTGAIAEEQELMATLSQAYLDWEQQTKQQGIQQGIQQGRQEGIQEGAQRTAQTLILRLLNRRVGILPDSVRGRIESLSVAQLETLGEALLEFSSLADLATWLSDSEAHDR